MLRTSTRVSFLVLGLVSGLLVRAGAQDRGRFRGPPAEPPPQGLVLSTDEALEGYTLFTPMNSGETYLVDNEGRKVHCWKSEYPPGQSVYLLGNGHLLRCATEPGNRTFRGGGQGGRIEEFDWDGNLLWTYVHSSAEHLQHHDIEPLPSGNVLLISWELRTREEALAAGRDEGGVQQAMWPDCVIEIEPIRPEGGKVVWEWHVWDHLVQDRDPGKPNYGIVAEHPELIDLNALRPTPETKEVELSPEEIAALEAIGYIGGEEEEAEEGGEGEEQGDGEAGDGEQESRGGPGGGPDMGADWNHINGIDYHPELDQIVLSNHNQHEIWVIDHSTTTEEAAGHSGGRYGRGGDLIYRWGNPAMYHAGTAEDQQLFSQHDARWIEEGHFGEGNLLVFNNMASGNVEGAGFGAFGPAFGGGGGGRGGGEGRRAWSAVVEIEPPLDPDGTYEYEPGEAYGPAEPVWSYSDPDGDSVFFSGFVSGAHRLSNDNTLICSGGQGRIFEVTPEGDVVWDFYNEWMVPASRGGPDGGFAMAPRGGPPGGGRPRGSPPRGFPGGFPMPGFGPGGGPGFGFGGMAPGMFRATRIAADHPALAGRELLPLEDDADRDG